MDDSTRKYYAMLLTLLMHHTLKSGSFPIDYYRFNDAEQLFKSGDLTPNEYKDYLYNQLITWRKLLNK